MSLTRNALGLSMFLAATCTLIATVLSVTVAVYLVAGGWGVGALTLGTIVLLASDGGGS